MTKKDYIELAKAIKLSSTSEVVNNGMVVYNLPEKSLIDKAQFLSDLCSILKQDNPNFDKQRFLEACK